MTEHERSHLTLPSGEVEHIPGQACAIDVDGLLTYGSDFLICGPTEMPEADRRFLAELMITRWQAFAEGRKAAR